MRLFVKGNLIPTRACSQRRVQTHSANPSGTCFPWLYVFGRCQGTVGSKPWIWDVCFGNLETDKGIYICQLRRSQRKRGRFTLWAKHTHKQLQHYGNIHMKPTQNNAILASTEYVMHLSHNSHIPWFCFLPPLFPVVLSSASQAPLSLTSKVGQKSAVTSPPAVQNRPNNQNSELVWNFV